MPDQRNPIQNDFLFVIYLYLLALVEFVMWLGLSIKLVQGGIYTPLTTPRSTMSWTKLWITLNPTPVPKLKPTLMTSLIHTEYFTHIPLPHIVADDAKDGYQFGNIVLVFVYWAIIGAPNYKTGQVRAYLGIIDSKGLEIASITSGKRWQ